MQPAELNNFFYFDSTNSRMMGYGTTPSIAHEDGAIAISITAQLLDRANKMPSGKWLWLQLQPEDAVALAGAILVLATAEGWPIRPDFLDAIEWIRLSGEAKH
jgi:hypothetical protein